MISHELQKLNDHTHLRGNETIGIKKNIANVTRNQL